MIQCVFGVCWHIVNCSTWESSNQSGKWKLTNGNDLNKQETKWENLPEVNEKAIVIEPNEEHRKKDGLADRTS